MVNLGWEYDAFSFSLIGKREDNQDSLIVDTDQDIFIIADGMGGRAKGKQASAYASQRVAALARDRIKTLLRHGKFNASVQGEELEEYFRQANTALHKASREEQFKGCGTTLEALLIQPNDSFLLGHVGDSRTYTLDERGILRQITTDHNYAQTHVEAKELTPEEALLSDDRSILTNYIGKGPEISIQSIQNPLFPVKKILMVTDGVYGAVTHQELQDILNNHSGQDAIDQLIARVKKPVGMIEVYARLRHWVPREHIEEDIPESDNYSAILIERRD